MFPEEDFTQQVAAQIAIAHLGCIEDKKKKLMFSINHSFVLVLETGLEPVRF